MELYPVDGKLTIQTNAITFYSEKWVKKYNMKWKQIKNE